MKILKHSITVLVILALLFGYIPLFQNNVWAAPLPVKIKVQSYTDGILKIEWDKVEGAKSYSVRYHMPDGTSQEIKSDSSANTCEISNLESDYIYDFKVTIYSGLDLSGSEIGVGLLYYLPRVTFYATQGEQTREPVPGGGYEIGNKPKLDLKWVMPKVWAGSIKYINEALGTINGNLETIYGENPGIVNLNFKINISSNASTLNSGASQSAVNIDYNGSGYEAYVSGNPDTKVVVAAPDSNGYMYLSLLGRKDTSTPLVKDEEDGDDILLHGDILPGTVYYMNIGLLFQNAGGISKPVVSVGAPSDFGASPLTGTFPYTYTPIRFQLSKDSLNNIYVKIYRINQGSLDLPRLYYEVQAVASIISDEWPTKKVIDDSFFIAGSQSALTLISGVGVNNKLYYRIVVKTDSTDDRLESLPMEYTLEEDTSRPPVPMGITIIDREPVKRIDEEGNIQHSSNITISWEKPGNWDQIRNNTDVESDIVYHILLNVAENEDLSMPYPELKADGVVYGNFPLKYRRVLYFSSKEVKENGNRLEYTIDGFNLFNGYYLDVGGEIKKEGIDNEEGYPDFLLPNTVYYMQMFTTTNANRNLADIENISDKSLIVSFTTRASNEIDVPIPKNLRLNVNSTKEVVVDETTIISNFIEIQFDKVNINWSDYLVETDVQKNIYYDVYMSNSTDLRYFTKIGTTEKPDDEDVTDIEYIYIEDNPANAFIRFRVEELYGEAINVFGPKLRPNTTYYFVVKTRLKVEEIDPDKESAFTSILSVTTVKANIGEPDETSRRPLAPVDFQIATDEDGNQILGSAEVTFSWTKTENDVVYNIIGTSRKVEPDEGIYEGDDDYIYQSFVKNFGEIILDPQNLDDKFKYDPVSNEFRYTIDEWLYPNKLYYFSIRAIRQSDNTKYSVWVSIPVTTYLIEQPEQLEAVTDVQLGFFFDDDLKTEAKDYNVYIKSEKELKFNLLSKNKYTIVKFGTLSYVRLVNLQPNTYYDVRVYKDGDSKLVYSKDELYTRDSSHELEIKWRGISQYRYEVAIMTVWDNDYVLLNESNLEEYVDAQGKILPYYAQKNFNTDGNEYEYYARIKSIPVRLEDGTYENQPLKSNTKYYIKVRAKKVDPVDSTIVSYSKFIGPIFIRTDFNQEDYDEEDNNTKIETSFWDRIKKLEEALFWRVNIKAQTENKLLLKGDRMINAIENSGSYSFTLDISYYAKTADIDILYIPIEVIKTLDKRNKSLLIRTNEAEYEIRPNTFDLDLRTEIDELMEHKNVKGVYLTLNIGRSRKANIPSEMKIVSYINRLDVEALGTSLTYIQLEKQIFEQLYNKDSGLLQKKLNEILNSKFKGDSKEMEKLLNDSIDSIEREISEFIYNKMEGGKGNLSINVKSVPVKNFDNPLLVTLMYNNESGLKLPNVRYSGSSKWQSLSRSTQVPVNKLAFNVIMTGEYAIFAQNQPVAGLSDDYQYTADIKQLLSKFDLSKAFGDMSLFLPEDSVNVKEIILLYEIVTGLDQGNSGLTINQKAQKYGLESLIGFGGVVRDVSRQETAKIIMMIYSNKTGVKIINLIPNSSKIAKDMSKVSNAYYKDVLISIDLGLLGLNDEGRFNPEESISKGELASSIVKLLKLTGDI